MEELPGGVWRVTMPLPTPLRHVHCYVLPVEDGFMVVDTGLGLPDARERWAAELAHLDGPVRTIFLTHFHPDHLGATADVQELTGARVVEGRLDAEQASLTWQSDAWVDVLGGWFRRNGLPEAITEELIEDGLLVRHFIRMAAAPELVDAGDELHGWELVAAPGHADGQMTLFREGILIAADHVLDPITPTVGLWPESRPDPLGDYLAALQRTIELGPTIAYSGHGEVITDPVGRAKEIIAHHLERLNLTAAILGPRPQTGYEVSLPLFGFDLRPDARRFAVAETLSHLEWLVLEGRAERRETEPDGNVGGVSYTAAQ